MNALVARTALATVVLATCAHAATTPTAKTYVFSGKSYTYFFPTGGCLTKSMHLTMYLNMAAPLSPNLSNQKVQPTSWLIKDGAHMFNDTWKKAIAPLNATFSTDANGKITAWSVDSYFYKPDKITILYTTHSHGNATSGGDYTDDYNCALPVPASSTGYVGSSSVKGSRTAH